MSRNYANYLFEGLPDAIWRARSMRTTFKMRTKGNFHRFRHYLPFILHTTRVNYRLDSDTSNLIVCCPINYFINQLATCYQVSAVLSKMLRPRQLQLPHLNQVQVINFNFQKYYATYCSLNTTSPTGGTWHVNYIICFDSTFRLLRNDNRPLNS